MTVYTGTRCRRRQLQRTEFAGWLDGSWWLAASHSCVTVVTLPIGRCAFHFSHATRCEIADLDTSLLCCRAAVLLCSRIISSSMQSPSPLYLRALIHSSAFSVHSIIHILQSSLDLFSSHQLTSILSQTAPSRNLCLLNN